MVNFIRRVMRVFGEEGGDKWGGGFQVVRGCMCDRKQYTWIYAYACVREGAGVYVCIFIFVLPTYVLLCSRVCKSLCTGVCVRVFSLLGWVAASQSAFDRPPASPSPSVFIM